MNGKTIHYYHCGKVARANQEGDQVWFEGYSIETPSEDPQDFASCRPMFHRATRPNPWKDIEAMNEGSKNAPTSDFTPLRSARRLEIIARDTPSRLRLFQAIYAGKATRNQCIKGQCLDCMGFDSVAVKECGDRLCPLWKFRPFQRKGKKL